MLDQQLARNLSSSGSIGLADLIEQQLRPPVPPVAPEAMPGAVDGGASSEAEQ
jgi:Rod binding domain-containing protein